MADDKAAEKAAADKAAAGSEGTGQDLTRESVVDLREGGQVELSQGPTDPYSATWAQVVRPVMIFLLTLLGTVMLLPFLITLWIFPSTLKVDLPPGTTPDQFAAAMKASVEALAAKRTDVVFDWAKTILPSVVGFASAMVGYYFGTRPSDSGRRVERGQTAATSTAANTRS